ncbi:unnamed protein product [Peniophora sp. CBMAI 1063]|nr:unnamed protein product [Peniophora sp. CBMAI 1063]
MSSIASELPVELLRRIFSFLPEIPPVAPKSWKKNVEYALAPPLPSTVTISDDAVSRRGWANAAFICRHWREVAFSMNRTIPIRIAPEESQKDIRRRIATVFAPLPVTIHVEQHLIENCGFGHGSPPYIYTHWSFTGQTEGPEAAPMLRLVVALRGRVTGIYAYLCNTLRSNGYRITLTPRLADFIRLASQLLPSTFNKLHIIAPGRNRRHGPEATRYLEDGVLDFPDHLLENRVLDALELRDCHFADPGPVFAHTNLRELTLIASTNSWPLPPSAGLKQLESLCLTLESIPKKDTIASMGQIELPSLQHLYLGGYMYNTGALLAKLSFPASTSIELRCDYNANTVVEHICPLVTPLAQHFEGSCARGEGFTDVTLRVGRLDVEMTCSAPVRRGSYSLLSPSTSFTVSLACRILILRNHPERARNFTTAIFEDLVGGICARVPHAAGVEQTLEVTVPSNQLLDSSYGYWVEAAVALRDITDVRVDYNTAQHLLQFIQARRASQADVPFPRLRRCTVLAADHDDVHSERTRRSLQEEFERRGVQDAVSCGDRRL